jgi:hypothetical protein
MRGNVGRPCENAGRFSNRPVRARPTLKRSAPVAYGLRVSGRVRACVRGGSVRKRGRTQNVQSADRGFNITKDLARRPVAAPHVVGCALTLWSSSAAPAPFALRFEHSNDVHLACLETEI